MPVYDIFIDDSTHVPLVIEAFQSRYHAAVIGMGYEKVRYKGSSVTDLIVRTDLPPTLETRAEFQAALGSIKIISFWQTSPGLNAIGPNLGKIYLSS
jgi:hypothetical protein